MKKCLSFALLCAFVVYANNASAMDPSKKDKYYAQSYAQIYYNAQNNHNTKFYSPKKNVHGKWECETLINLSKPSIKKNKIPPYQNQWNPYCNLKPTQDVVKQDVVKQDVSIGNDINAYYNTEIKNVTNKLLQLQIKKNSSWAYYLFPFLFNYDNEIRNLKKKQQELTEANTREINWVQNKKKFYTNAQQQLQKRTDLPKNIQDRGIKAYETKLEKME